jgi:hypothetical protein
MRRSLRRLPESFKRLLAGLAKTRRARPVALIALGGIALIGLLADLTVDEARTWFADHQFATALLSEAILLAAVYAVVDRLVRDSEARRWRKASAEPLRHIQSAALRLDGNLNQAISDDRQSIDMASDHIPTARLAYNDLKANIDRYQALLTASPYMVEFLPVAIDLEKYAGYLLRPGPFSTALGIEWYDDAVKAFAAKFGEAVDLREYSARWLDYVPRQAFLLQLREFDGEDNQRFLRAEMPPRE